jgi:hypothetical protein
MIARLVSVQQAILPTKLRHPNVGTEWGMRGVAQKQTPDETSRPEFAGDVPLTAWRACRTSVVVGANGLM